MGKEWGLDAAKSGLYPALGGWVACLQILIFPCVTGFDKSSRKSRGI